MKIIESLFRNRIWSFCWMSAFQIILISAGTAGAAVTTYECSEDLEMPGSVIWTRMIVDSGQAAHTMGVSIAPAGDGSSDFLITGSAQTDASDDEYGLVVKMDLSGNMLDNATFLWGCWFNNETQDSPI